MSKGKIVMGALAPHPPHLVYAENPPQNEAKSEGGWEELRWGYERLRNSMSNIDYDVIVIHTPHWQTFAGTHFLGVEKFKSLSVDPVFPNLFRYNYDLKVDVKLSKSIHDGAADSGLHVKMMENPDFRIDYGTITSCHLVNPAWDKPIVCISSNRSKFYFNAEVMQANMIKLGEATRKAIEASGKKALLLSSNSLSHRHFTVEPEVPEDMSQEHVTNHHQYLWDMKMINLMKEGKTREMIDFMPDFTEQTIAETEAGSLTWLISALGFPDYEAIIHAYGTVIGTGNAIVGWDPSQAKT
jgi:2-aminophenol/2-amino-5-chlorophenol 1,6-dioxygenase beta subunit